MFRVDYIYRRQRPFPVTVTSTTISSSSGNIHQPKKLMIPPQSGSYERLESGMGPSRVGLRNFTWRRIALCLALVVAFVWFLSPTNPKKVWDGTITPGEFWVFTMQAED